MRETFAHVAVVWMDPGADLRAPGAAVTVALCGRWEHPPPCPLPHHSRAERVGEEVRLRVLFAAEPEAEADVRRRIDRSLRSGLLCGPGGGETRWRLRTSGRDALAAAEEEHARLLAGS